MEVGTWLVKWIWLTELDLVTGWTKGKGSKKQDAERSGVRSGEWIGEEE